MKQCPYCLNEISEFVIQCPNCGKKLQNIDYAAIREKSLQKRTEEQQYRKKRITKAIIKFSIVILSLAIITAVSSAIYSYYEHKKYINNCKEYFKISNSALKIMHENVQQTETIHDLVDNMGQYYEAYNASSYRPHISADSKKYLFPNGKIVKNLDDAIAAFYAEDNIKSEIESISNDKQTIEKYMDELHNIDNDLKKYPNNDIKEYCDLVNDLYDSYIIIIDSTINNPSKLYSNDIQNAYGNFKTAYLTWQYAYEDFTSSQ